MCLSHFFVVVLHSLNMLFCFIQFCFLVFKDSIDKSFSSAMSRLLISPLKSVFISVAEFLIFSISFWISISLHTVLLCFYIPFTLSIRFFCIFLLNSLLDNVNIPNMPDSDACFISSNSAFCLLCALWFLSWSVDIMYWVKGTVNRPIVLWWRGLEEGKDSVVLCVSRSPLSSGSRKSLFFRLLNILHVAGTE